jgi:hypothetical protein
VENSAPRFPGLADACGLTEIASGDTFLDRAHSLSELGSTDANGIMGTSGLAPRGPHLDASPVRVRTRPPMVSAIATHVVTQCHVRVRVDPVPRTGP